ncbi:MAG: hypothetical protein ACLQUY_21905 [Ktedonobacterales bacterium]
MAISITVLHVRDHHPSEVEEALATIFAEENRAHVLRIEGTFSAVRSRLDVLAEEAGYRYLILRPANNSAWTPVLEVGNRTIGLEARLSRLLNGSAVFTTFVYGDVISGYRLARSGVEVDRYASDPSILQVSQEDAENPEEISPGDQEASYELERGHPERFADLLPDGTTALDFAQVVLRPGWWQDYDRALIYNEALPGTEPDKEEEGEELVELVDEVDRMRCIALALELFGPSEYPFAQDTEDVPNHLAGPAIALAFA